MTVSLSSTDAVGDLFLKGRRADCSKREIRPLVLRAAMNDEASSLQLRATVAVLDLAHRGLEISDTLSRIEKLELATMYESRPARYFEAD